MRRDLELALALGLAAATASPAFAATLRVEGTPAPGSAKRVALPDYPAELRERRAAGFVDIAGRVTPAGTLADVEIHPGPGDARLLVEPLRAVLAQWRFEAPVDDDCRPTTARVTNRLWFEVDDRGKPKLDIEPPAAPGPALHPVARHPTTYPYSMERMALEANVFAKLTIGPGGEVTSVRAAGHSPEGAANLARFERETEENLARWRFGAAAERAERIACMTVLYRPETLTGFNLRGVR